jgi:hypothetical protein
MINEGRFSIAICERDLPDGTWRDILDSVRMAPRQSLLIVASKLADDYLWAEVLNLGGFDVLARPFCDREVQHVLETACLGARERSTCYATAG